MATLNQGLARCRAGYGDTVLLLPGHTENIATADAMSSLVSGTRIVGSGHGGLMPTLRWTANAATFLFDVANVFMSGLRLRMEGDTAVAAPITVSAADCTITGCDIETSSGASNLATIPITVTTGARFAFIGNRMRGVVAGASTTGISVTGLSPNLCIVGNDIQIPCGVNSGVISVTSASLDMVIRNNLLSNITASSVDVLLINQAAASGIIANNYCALLANGTLPGTGGITVTAGVVKCFENYSCDEPGLSGEIDPLQGT